jgi:hypothetical protein
MIKFFRKIRQNIINDQSMSKTGNRTSKYLLYAIGEIILVVIGILIALQVNEWNIDRNKKKAEHIVLVQIKSDLEKSQLDLIEMKAYHLIRTKASAMVLHSFWKTELPNDSIADNLSMASTINYSPILGNLKSLINSGNIDLVSSKEFKNNIVSYVEKVESQLKDMSRAEESYFRKGVEIIFEIMPNGFQDKDYYLKRIEEFNLEEYPRLYEPDLLPIPTAAQDIDKVPFKADLSELFQNKQFFSGYYKLWVFHFNSYRIYDEILVITNELLDKLNANELIKNTEKIAKVKDPK